MPESDEVLSAMHAVSLHLRDLFTAMVRLEVLLHKHGTTLRDEPARVPPPMTRVH